MIEIKYDHRLPSGKNQPRTQRAADVLAAVFRLAQWPGRETDRYLVYVTDDEMASYMRDPRNGFSAWLRGTRASGQCTRV